MTRAKAIRIIDDYLMEHTRDSDIYDTWDFLKSDYENIESTLIDIKLLAEEAAMDDDK